MKRITDIIILTTVLVLTGCKGVSPLEPEIGASESRPIEFGISSDLTVGSKATIDNTNYTANGFSALGVLTVNDTDAGRQVFAPNTVVTYNTTSNSWMYSPLRYWQPGSYIFAGVMPESGYTATLDADNRLTLAFADGGFDLAATQKDLMVAFDTETVSSTSTAGPVEFCFAHQMALVTIEGASKEANTDKIRIDQIKVYGNNTSTKGNMVFSSDGTYSYTLTGGTSATQPYKTYSHPTGTGIDASYDWQLVRQPVSGNPVYDILVPDLLVFPEECSFTIEVTYTDFYNGNEITVTKRGTKEVNWGAGKKYIYSFIVSLDDIEFTEPTVEPWPGTSQKLDNDIEM